VFLAKGKNEQFVEVHNTMFTLTLLSRQVGYDVCAGAKHALPVRRHPSNPPNNAAHPNTQSPRRRRYMGLRRIDSVPLLVANTISFAPQKPSIRLDLDALRARINQQPTMTRA